MRWSVAILACAGCNSVFGIQKTGLQDAYIPDQQLPDAPDMDHDGVADEADNCPMMANADQADYDGDGAGDVCDTCPIVANNQADDADGDDVGDECDPHPDVGSTPKDCLLLFDSFTTQAEFAAAWTIVSDPADMNPDVQVTGAHSLVLTPHSPYMLGVTATGITSADAVELVGSAVWSSLGSFNRPTAAGTLERIDTMTGLDCWMTTGNVQAQIDGSVISAGTFFGDPVRRRFLLTTVADVTSGSAKISCRADWGLAVATTTGAGTDPGKKGGAGILSGQMPTTISAAAIYGRDPDPLCHVIKR